MTTISDDEFMTNLTSLIDRPLTALSEDHFYFLGPDPQIMMHVWYENGFYFGGISERNYRLFRVECGWRHLGLLR